MTPLENINLEEGKDNMLKSLFGTQIYDKNTNKNSLETKKPLSAKQNMK